MQATATVPADLVVAFSRELAELDQPKIMQRVLSAAPRDHSLRFEFPEFFVDRLNGVAPGIAGDFPAEHLRGGVGLHGEEFDNLFLELFRRGEEHDRPVMKLQNLLMAKGTSKDRMEYFQARKELAEVLKKAEEAAPRPTGRVAR